MTAGPFRLKQIAPSGALDGDVATYDSASGLWIPKAPSGGGGGGIVGSYGELYEDDAAGTTEILVSPADTWYQWDSTTAGESKGAPFVTLDTDLDRLIIGSDGPGTYGVMANAALKSSGNAITRLRVRKNGSDAGSGLKSEDQKSAGQRLDLSISGEIALVENDYLELWITSSVNVTTLTLYYINLSIFRIDGDAGFLNNLDGGEPDTVYGGGTAIDGGGP